MSSAVVGVLVEALVEGVGQALEGLLAPLQALLAVVATVVVAGVALEGVEVVGVEEVVAVAEVVAPVEVSPWPLGEASSLAEEVVLPPQRLCCNGSCNCKADRGGSRCLPETPIADS